MSTFYHSTRSCNELVTSKQAILGGIAPDGGLYVADALGTKKLDLAQVCSQTYQQNAELVLGTLLDDYTPSEIATCVEGAYGSRFDTELVAPVTELGSDWLLELFHGPTCAFKDVALQMLPRLMSAAREPDSSRIMIVTATSGDTGKAALDGFAGVDSCGVTVFYPEGKVSDVQHLQMVTQAGANVAVCAVRGNFDDAQSEVKRIFANKGVASRLADSNIVLSSANSINVGRLVPQVVYYFDAYAQLMRRGALAQGEQIDFCVPTGNFGDVLAGYYAKMLGLPVRKLIVASNSNDVLVDFITTGTYDRRRDFVKTISPSMDILVSSNLERLLFYLSDGDVELVSSLMSQLAEQGHYSVPAALLERVQETFATGRASDEQTREEIRATWENNHVLLDTHTAVAKHVLDQIDRDGVQRVCLATASPFKFPADVLEALGHNAQDKSGFVCMDELSELTGFEAPEALSALRDAKVLHRDVVDVEQMASFVEARAQEILA